MQKLQDSVFSILKTTSLSPAVFSFLQPTDDNTESTPLGGILRDTKHGWLALGPKFCVVDLRSGLKVAAKTFGNGSSNISVTSVIELPKTLTHNSKQLVISLECDDCGLICVLHINGSQILRCIQSDVIITELALCDDVSSGPFTCFDGLIMAGTQRGEIFVIDLNRSALLQALNDIAQGNAHLVKTETDPATLVHISLKVLHKIERQGELPANNDEHLAVLLNEDSFIDYQYIFRNPDGTPRMKAKQDHVRVTVVQYIPQLGSLAVGFNFGAFQLWNILDLALEFTSQVNVECLPVTHFGFQEPCDDPRAFCYLWVVFSVIDRFEEHEFPLAVMYSLTYQGKRMLVDNKCLYQEFSTATVRFQVELGSMDHSHLIGGRCISCHTYSINTMLGDEGEEAMLNLCQLVWECWGERATSSHYGMLLFDLDQWYKDQMPATYQLQSNTFMSTAWCSELGRGCLSLDMRLDPVSLSPYSHATRLEEHFYPNSLQYDCVCLNTSEAIVLHTVGIQRQIISSMSEAGPSCLLSPARLYTACLSAGLMPLYRDNHMDMSMDEQRKFILSVALEARLSQLLKRCAQEWATGTHAGVGCTLTFLVDWSWRRAIELKENAKELISPLFTSATLPDRNVIRCLEHCVQQLTQLTGLLDAVLTKCCNLVVPDALSEMEEKYKGIGTVSLYFQVVQWFLRVGLLPERNHPHAALPYPAEQLYSVYKKRRVKLHRIQGDTVEGDPSCVPCPLLYVDQLILNEFGGEVVHKIWKRAGSECGGLYPPPSLYALLRLYLLPDISEEHKHSLLLYLLLDYSMLYDDSQYETVIRRLMQFPPMFGLSTTLVRATQAFWHLDHRDFHFALDQLQCLTGNTLSDWQHQVVLSSLLAQKKSQAALQYLHVRKPAPIQNVNKNDLNCHDKLEDWQSCCDLYLARGLVFEALDVVRMCVQNVGCNEDKVQVLDYFFKGCRNTGQLAKVLQVTLLPVEEECFIKYLKDCNEAQTSDILVMYLLQQARYLEAEQYNKQIKSKPRYRGARSTDSLAEAAERDSIRDTLVAALVADVPRIAGAVAALLDSDYEPHVLAPKPMSVYVKPNSPKNTFTYKSSFVQDTIENASETWMNKPKIKKGLKRALNIEDTPFICTPKLYKTKSYLSEQRQNDSTPAKRARLDLSPKTPRNKPGSAVKVSQKLSEQIATLLDMPDVESPRYKHSTRPETPQSILKSRRAEWQESAVSVTDLAVESDDDMDTASNHTHYSDSTNKHLRFTIPTPTELPSTSPVAIAIHKAPDSPDNEVKEQDKPLESPPKKFAAESKINPRKSYKDSVRARKSLSISANSSLSDDPNTSIESIADIPVTLINPRYTGERRSSRTPEPEERKRETDVRVPRTRVSETRRFETESSEIEVRFGSSVTRTEDAMEFDSSAELSFVPKTPKGRRSIRSGVSESTPLANRYNLEQSRSRSGTPERQDSPIVTPLRSTRATRSRSRTPEVSPRASPLPAILEVPKLEQAELNPTNTLSVPTTRSRSRTPERIERVMESPRLEVIKESPTKPSESPTRRSLRSRSRTPEVEIQKEQHILESPRSLRSRSKTPEKLMSPKKDITAKGKKSLSRMVLEANTFAKTKQNVEKVETESSEEKSESVIECTPMKPSKQATSLMDVTFSPIVNKSVLQSSNDSLSITTEKVSKMEESSHGIKSLPAFTSIHEVFVEKSVLHSYQSSIGESSSIHEESVTHVEVKSLPFTTFNEDAGKSVLHSFESSAETSVQSESKVEKLPPEMKLDESVLGKSVLGNESTMEKRDQIDQSSLMTNDSDMDMDKDWKSQMEQDTARVIQKEKEKIVEIEREINEIEGEMSDDECREESDSSTEVEVEVEEVEEEEESEESSEEESSSEDEAEVISINDSDSDSNQLQIQEVPVEQVAQENIISEENVDNNVVVESPDETNENKEFVTAKQSEVIQVIEVVDDLNQAHASILTDDNSVIESEQSGNLNYSEEKEEKVYNNIAMETDQDQQVNVTVSVVGVVTENKMRETDKAPIDMDVVDATTKESTQNIEEKMVLDETHKDLDKREKITNSDVNKDKIEAKDTEIAETKTVGELVKGTQIEKATPRTRKRSTSTKSQDTPADTAEIATEKAKPRSRRGSTTDTDKDVELKTPTRTRTASERSEQNIPETPENDSPRRGRRSKTPNTEIRKILTRRASRELSEKDDDVMPLEELTPRRRTRASRKKDDDTASVASESSGKSAKSRASEDGDRGGRKGRKSILSTRTDLSVIPEAPLEDAVKDSQEDVSEYSSARRLLRSQKAVLETVQAKSPGRRRRPSEETSTSFDVQTIDPISLLDKTDFEGPPDPEELQNSPDSLVSSASKPRGRRAASETKTLVKPARIARRISADVSISSPVAADADADTPTRGRRASFTRACQAIHTPKRRTSTDVKKRDTDSKSGSPVTSERGTPTRRNSQR
ncbi:protein ELYS [Zerene cesonia]|uniref:protein ELYS n=1 Tax=Zerene cesonia TaxID=33412 RepID=UPI0018E5226E|nr:protein ELYS [Zerene cesonia]